MSQLVTPAPTPPTATIWHSVEGLHRALRERAEAIALSRLQIDRHSGLPEGYSAKLLAPRPAKKLSLEGICKLAPALGLDLGLIENPDYMVRIRSRSPLRDPSHTLHADTVQYQFSLRHIRRIAKRGGQNSRKYMTRREAKMLARKAATARWSAHAKELGP